MHLICLEVDVFIRFQCVITATIVAQGILNCGHLTTASSEVKDKMKSLFHLSLSAIETNPI
jgi:hypothetical protein